MSLLEPLLAVLCGGFVGLALGLLGGGGSILATPLLLYVIALGPHRRSAPELGKSFDGRSATTPGRPKRGPYPDPDLAVNNHGPDPGCPGVTWDLASLADHISSSGKS